MFDNIFSFDGRIGRLRYVLQTMLLGVCSGLAVVLIMLLFYPARHQTLGFVFVGLCMLVLVPTMLWISFALQARRFRDIGWNPLYVIAAWLVITFLDALAVHMNPALSLGTHRGTIVGALVNLALSLSLLFWPGRADEDFGTGRGPARTTRLESLGIDAAAAPRSMPMPRGTPRRQFGRRNA